MLFLATTFLWLAPVHAVSRDQLLAEEILATIARETGKQVARGYVEKYAEREIANQVTKGAAHQAVRAGAAFVYAVDLGLSLKDFRESKTDKGRSYSTMNMGIAMAGLAFPVVGMAATAAVMVLRIIDGIADAQSAKKLAEIYARTAGYQRQTEKEKLRRVNARRAVVEWYVTQSEDVEKLLEEGNRYLREKCAEPRKLDSLDSVDGCLKSVFQAMSQAQRHLNALTLLDRYAALETVHAEVIRAGEAIKDAEKKLAPILDEYSRATERALMNSSSDAVRAGKSVCLDRITHLGHAVQAAQREPLREVVPEAYFEDSIERGFMIQEVSSFNQSPCALISSDDPDLDDLFSRHYTTLLTDVHRLEDQ